MSGRDATDALLAQLADRASAEAGAAVSPDVLSAFLPALVRVAGADRRMTVAELEWCRQVGIRAAADGVALPALVDAYLSATRLVWVGLDDLLPRATGGRLADRALVGAGQRLFRAADDALAAVATGYVTARRSTVRAEEASWREFVDDVLAGQGRVEDLVGRAERFGIRLTAPHLVAVCRAEKPFTDAGVAVSWVAEQVALRMSVGEALVATKEGLLVCVLPAVNRDDRSASVETMFEQMASARRWQVAIGRPFPGPGGVAASHREARETLEWAERLGWSQPVLVANRLGVYRVLLRDRDAITELLDTVLGPLRAARNAEALLETVATYLACGGVATQTARRMHLSVRAVTYRLGRVRLLTGYDPADPADWLTLQAVITGAKLLGWTWSPRSV